jgi:hypothetical protein
LWKGWETGRINLAPFTLKKHTIMIEKKCVDEENDFFMISVNWKWKWRAENFNKE